MKEVLQIEYIKRSCWERLSEESINTMIEFRKGQVCSTLYRRKCMKRCTNLNEAKEVRKNRNVVSGYPHGTVACAYVSYNILDKAHEENISY